MLGRCINPYVANETRAVKKICALCAFQVSICGFRGTFDASVTTQRVASAMMGRYTVDMDGRLIAAARSLLGWSQDELAKRAGVSRRTITGLEGGGDPKRSTESKVLGILKAEGVEFTEAPDRVGVALRRDG